MLLGQQDPLRWRSAQCGGAASIAAGMLAFAGPHWVHGAALITHETVFYPWLLILIMHTVGYFAEALRLAAADLLTRVACPAGRVSARQCVDERSELNSRA
jgi:hypothetical protein